MNLSKEGNTLKSFNDFNCCCEISSKHFEIDGGPTMEVIRSVLAVPTSFAATLGNFLVLISIWRTPSLHTPSNVLLVSLALTDFGVGLITTPLFLVFNIAKIKRDADLFCSNVPGFFFASSSFCGVSFLTLTAVSLERFIALRIHLRYKEIVTIKRTGVATGVIWSLGFAYGALSTWNFNVVVYLSAVVIPICFVVTTFSYCAIYRVVRRHQAEIEGQLPPAQVEQQEGNALSMTQYKHSFISMFLIYFVFVFCYTPYLVLSTVLVTANASLLLYSATQFSLTLIHINSVLNPIIYCWRFANIRDSVKETARRLLWKNSSE